MSRLLSKQLSTAIILPPGIPPGATVRKVLRLCIETYGWFKPARYSIPWGWETILPGQPFLDEVMRVYEEEESLLILGRTEREGLGVSSSPVYEGGNISCWRPTDKLARSDKSREAHVQQVVELMRLLDSPLAYTALYDDAWRKTHWEVRGELEFLMDYSEGLVGLFWHTFLGPPFVRLFGDRLSTLPPGTARNLGGDIWLIEPYPMPADAFTGDGQARERALIEHLGKECFFDYEHQVRATRRPDLPAIDIEAAYRKHDRPKYEKKYGKGSPQVESALKGDEIFRWTARHEQDVPSSIRDAMRTWVREHGNDPDFSRVTPEQVFETVRAQLEKESEKE